MIDGDGPSYELKPFHESVVVEIESAEGEYLYGLLRLISRSLISKDHKKILDAIYERFRFLGLSAGIPEVESVKGILFYQQQELEKKKIAASQQPPVGASKKNGSLRPIGADQLV